jgi:hypothetical protein
MNMHLRNVIYPILAVLLGLSSCEKPSSGKEGASTDTGDVHPPSKNPPLKQIPAAEVLGSTVKRNLRYQTEAETAEYIALDTLLEYIRQIDLSLRRQIGKLTPEPPSAGTVVVGLNALQETRLWYVFPEGQPSPAFKAAAEKAVAAVRKPAVKKRLVVFGVALALWGYKETEAEAAKVELPKSWQAISKSMKAPQPATKLAEMTWNDPAP